MIKILQRRKAARPEPILPAGVRVRCLRCDALLETTQATKAKWVEEHTEELDYSSSWQGWKIRCPECGFRHVWIDAPAGVSR